MRSDSTRFATSRQESSQSIAGVILYLEAIGCARFSPIELMLVANTFVHGWIRPRFLDGERKVRPIKLSPSELSAKTGFLRTRIQETMKSLRIANVLLQDETGLWRLNPRWQDWMDKKGRPRIPSLYHEFILDVLSEVERSPFRVVPDQATLPPNGDVPPLTLPPNGDVPPLTLPPNGDVLPPNGVVALSSDGDTSDPRAISPRARPEDLLCILPSIGENTEVSLNVCVNSLVPSARDAHAQDSERAEPFSHTHTQESECNPPCTEAPGEGKSPEPGAVSSPLSLKASNPDSTPESLPAVHPNNHAHTHTENAERIARYGSSLKGDYTPDPERLAVARQLVEDHMGGNDGIACGIGLNQYRYPSEWIVKALKRTIATKRNEHGHCPVRNFRYVEIILAGWKDAEGPESGPEEAFDDRMQLLPPKPKGAKVPDARQPAQPELTTEEKNAKFQELIHKHYPHFASEREPTPRFRGPEPEGYVPVFRTTVEPNPAG